MNIYVPWCDCQKAAWEKHKQPINCQLVQLVIPGMPGLFIGCTTCHKIDWTRSFIDVGVAEVIDIPLLEYKECLG